MTIYFAGPLFSRAELEFNAHVATALRAEGFEVILPQEFENGIAKDEHFSRLIFAACMKGLESADVVIAVVDGADPDSGTCFELGYAYAQSIPSITVRTDFRGVEDGPDKGVNLMITQSATRMLHGVGLPMHDLIAALLQELRALQ